MKMAETYFAKNGETLEGIWFERAAAFERAEFNALNAHLPATLPERSPSFAPTTFLMVAMTSRASFEIASTFCTMSAIDCC